MRVDSMVEYPLLPSSIVRSRQLNLMTQSWQNEIPGLSPEALPNETAIFVRASSKPMRASSWGCCPYTPSPEAIREPYKRLGGW
jgi:hypothetical protein